LRCARCSDDRDHSTRHHPGEGNLRRRHTETLRNSGNSDGYLPVALVERLQLHGLHAHGAGQGLAARVLATEDPAGQRRPGGHADIVSLSELQVLAFYRALDQAVFELHARDRRKTAQIAESLGARHDPGRHVGEADVQDLAGGYRVVEGPLDLFHRRGEVPPVDEIQVNVIDGEPPEAGIERTYEALAMHAGGIRITGAGNGVGV